MEFSRAKPLGEVTLIMIVATCVCRASAGTEKAYSLKQIFEQSADKQRLKANCGPVALARCLRIIGQDVDLSEVMSRFRSKSDKGVLLGELIEVSKEFAPGSVDCQIPKDSLEQLKVPSILLVDEGKHCLVLESLLQHEATVRIWDPTTLGGREVPFGKLKERWNGETIQFRSESLFPWMKWATIAFCCGALLLFAVFRRGQDRGE